MTISMRGVTTPSGTCVGGTPFIRYSVKNGVCLVFSWASARGTTRTARPVVVSTTVTPNFP